MERTLFDEIRSVGGEGILTTADMESLSGAVLRVYELMRDKEWHSREEINAAAGNAGKPALEGLRRMRTLRRWYTIERRRMGDARLWEYRLL